MDNTTILPDSLKRFDHIKAFDVMLNARMNSLDVDSLLVYLINTVDSSVLPYLAQQFNVDGNSGWLSANTDEQKRALIKKGIDINRKIGTVYAIKEAMLSLGYGEAVLVEGVGGNWADFDIQVDLADAQGLNGETATKLTNLINEYKNARSRLIAISFVTNIEDSLSIPEDDLTFNISIDIEDELQLIGAVLYDGLVNYDGSRTYDDLSDTLEFNEETI